MADFKPTDLLIGFIDFFAVLLPGAVLTFVLQLTTASFWQPLLVNSSREAKWIAFVVTSYLLGHFVFLIGAAFLDDLYDATYVKRHGIKRRWRLLKRVIEIKRESLQDAYQIENHFKWARAFVKFNKPDASIEIDRLEADSKFFRSLTVVAAAGWVLTGVLTGVYKRSWASWLLSLSLILIWFVLNHRPVKSWKLNKIEWKSFLKNRDLQRPVTVESERARLGKQLPWFWSWRRSFNRLKKLIVFYQYATIFALFFGAIRPQGNWWPIVICFSVMCLSAWRFADQRWKMTQIAYLYFVLLNPPAEKPESKPEPVPSVSDQVKTLLQDIWGGKN